MRLERIPTRSHLLAKILVVLLWLIAIAAVAAVGWLAVSDLVKRQRQPPAPVRHADVIETPAQPAPETANPTYRKPVAASGRVNSAPDTSRFRALWRVSLNSGRLSTLAVR